MDAAPSAACPPPPTDRQAAHLAGAQAPLALLGVLLIAAGALASIGTLEVIGPGGTDWGPWRFPFTLAFFFATAAACTTVPSARVQIILAASLIQLLAFQGPIKSIGALAIWSAFYGLVHLRASWWLKVPLMAGIWIAPIAVAALRPASGLFGILLVAHFASTFMLRAPLYAYEATKKKDQMKGVGYGRYLLYLIAVPLSAVKAEPVGFLALHRGLRSAVDPDLMRRGVAQMALGLAYLTSREIGLRWGILVSGRAVAAAADDLNALTVLVGAHLGLLEFFLSVAGHIHLGIGMLRVLGFDIMPGSDAPYASRNVLDWWRRWNVWFRDWLLALGYYPVVMRLKRRPYVAVAVAGAFVFLLSGFAHAMLHTLRNPRAATWELVVGTHLTFVAQGALVVVWMMREAVQVRRRGARRAGAAAAATPPAPWAFLRRFVFAAVTATVIALVMILFNPPLGFPSPAAWRTLAALTRVG